MQIVLNVFKAVNKMTLILQISFKKGFHRKVWFFKQLKKSNEGNKKSQGQTLTGDNLCL